MLAFVANVFLLIENWKKKRHQNKESIRKNLLRTRRRLKGLNVTLLAGEELPHKNFIPSLISSLCSSTLQSFANPDFPEFFNVFVVSVETPGTWKRPGIIKKGNWEKTCGGQLWDSAGMSRSQNTIGVWWEKYLEMEKCFLKSRGLTTRANYTASRQRRLRSKIEVN